MLLLCSLSCFMLLLCSLSCVATCPIINPLLCFFALQSMCCHLSNKKPYFMLLYSLLTSVHVSCPFVYVHPGHFCFFPFPLSIFLPVPIAVLSGFFSHFFFSHFPILSLFCHSHPVPPPLLSSLRSLFLSFGLAFLTFGLCCICLFFFQLCVHCLFTFFGFLWTEVLKTCVSFA